MRLEHGRGPVAAERTLEAAREHLAPHLLVHDGHAVQIGFDRGARERFERGLGAEHARRPVGFRIPAAEKPERRPANAERQDRAHALFQEMEAIAPISAEALVTPVPRQRNRHVLACQLADAIRRDRRAVGVGLVVYARERVDEIVIVARDLLDKVARAVLLCHHLRELRFVERRVVERDGARVHGLLRNARHRRDDRARIDAAGQERPERHFGDHAQAHRLGQPAIQLFARLRQPYRIVQRELHVPVFTRRRQRRAALDPQRMARRQLEHALEDGARLGDVAEREVFLDRARIDLAAHARMHEQRLQLRAEEHQAIGQHRVVQRLHAEAIAGHEQRARVPVVEREREHAAETLHALFAPRFPRVHDHFGVALRVEHVPERFELRNELLVVVDLAVEYDDDRAVLVVERLLAGGDIDDREAAMREPHASVDVIALAIGPAMGLRSIHPREHCAIDLARATAVEHSADATHIALTPPSGRRTGSGTRAPSPAG